MEQLSLTDFLSKTKPIETGQVQITETQAAETQEIIRIDIEGKSQKEINEELRQAIQGNTAHPEDLINYYEGFGAEIKSEKGIVGLNEARRKNLGQFFTSLEAAKLIVDILKIPNKATVLDSSCGIGRLAWHLPNKTLFTGIEFEENAYNIAKRIYPDSCIIHDDFINHNIIGKFDYVLLNPPFSLQLKSLYGNFEHISYGGGILSHVAALEQGIRAVRHGGYFAIIVPANIWHNESTRTIHKYLTNHSEEVAKIYLPKDSFSTTDWRCCLLVFKKGRGFYSNEEKTRFDYELDSFDKKEQLLKEFRQTRHYEELIEYSENCNSDKPIILKKHEEQADDYFSLGKRPYPENNEIPCVTITISRNKLRFKPNNSKAALKLQNIFANFDVKYDYSLKEYFETLPKNLILDDVWSSGRKLEDMKIFRLLKVYNLKYKIHDSCYGWLNKKKRQYLREVTPFEQWVKPTEDGKWIEYNKDEGIKSSLKELYAEKEKILSGFYKEFPHLKVLYNYQKEDVIRTSLKNRAIIALQQGLGKTKTAIALSILKNTKRSLFIVPSHLKDTWLEEFRNFSIDVHVIGKPSDVFKLKKFNLITYNRLKSRYDNKKSRAKIDNASGKAYHKYQTYADILKRKFRFVAADEAHYLSNKTTAQTKAVARMKPKYFYLLTGTPIGNTVKNLYSLLDILYKATSPYFPYTTKSFREEFVTVEWVTPEFDDTLSSGRTAQQMADINNLDKFIKLMEHKWLRRVTNEPKVTEETSIPQPLIKLAKVKPAKEQLEHYKIHLEEFYRIFQEYLHQDEDSDHKVNQSIVLAHLQNLQYCATMPQHPKVNPSTEFSYKGKITKAQALTIDIIKKHYMKKEKLVLFTQRKDYPKLLKKWLQKHNIRAETFTGDTGIDKRNKILDEFREGSLNVLLATINVIDTGLNIPQAKAAVFVEPDWKYSKIEQAYRRLLRPQTKKAPVIYLIQNLGTIDQYLWQHCMTKKTAIEEALERKEDVEKQEWTHWKDFIISMLKQEGLMEA